MDIQIDWTNAYTIVATAAMECLSGLILFPFKRKKIHILTWFLGINLMFVLVYILRPQGVWGNFLAVIVELYGEIAMLGVFFGGSLWKNTLVHYININVINAVSIGGYLLIPGMKEAMQRIKTGQAVAVKDGMLIVCIMLVATVLISPIFRKIFRTEVSPRKESIYKLCAWTYIIGFICIYTGSQALVLHYAKQYDASKVTTVWYWSYLIVIQFLMVNLLAFLYNRMEIRRLERDKLALNEIIAGKYAYYKKVAQENRELRNVRQELYREVQIDGIESKEQMKHYAQDLNALGEELVMIPLSGNLTIDSILYQYYKRAGEDAVVFDATIEPMSNLTVREEDLTSMLDCALQFVYEHCILARDRRWMAVNLRSRNGMLMLKLEGCKVTWDSYKRHHKFYLPGVPKEYRKNLKLLQKIVESHKGIIEVENQEEEGCVCIFLPRE